MTLQVLFSDDDELPLAGGGGGFGDLGSALATASKSIKAASTAAGPALAAAGPALEAASKVAGPALAAAGPALEAASKVAGPALAAAGPALEAASKVAGPALAAAGPALQAASKVAGPALAAAGPALEAASKVAGPAGTGRMKKPSLKTKLTKEVKRVANNMFGEYGDIVMCNIKHIYIWGVFIVLFSMAWVRALLVVNRAFRVHIVALGPYLDTASMSNRKTGQVVLLERRASRFVLFAILFLAIMSLLLFLVVTILFLWAVMQIAEMFADEMPSAIWFLADMIRAFCGTDTFFGAMQVSHIKIHGIVFGTMILVCWLYSYVYFREGDLVNATFLRDKFMRCLGTLPLIAIVLYGFHLLHVIVKVCYL
jgi:hypothetical protein